MKNVLVIVTLAMMAVLSSCGGNNSKQVLFNGENLEGWTCILDEGSNVPTSEVYGVKDGNIHIIGNPFGYMRTTEKYSNYKLHAEWRWVGEGTNSGLFLHVQDGDKLWPNAIECQLCNGKAGDFVMLGGSKIAEVECKGQFPIKDRIGNFENPIGEWNTAEVVCEGNSITVPSFRNDLTCMQDIAEEIIRIYGYNKIKSTCIYAETTQGGRTPKQQFEVDCEYMLYGMGFDQIQTFSFISPKYYDKIRMPEDSALRRSVVITNPLGEDTSVMRTVALPSMMEVVARNVNFSNEDVRTLCQREH